VLFAERSSGQAGAQQRLGGSGQQRGGGLTPFSPGELGSSQHVMSFHTPYPLLYRQINSQDAPQHAASPPLPAPAAAVPSKQAAGATVAAAQQESKPAVNGAETCTGGEVPTDAVGTDSNGNGGCASADVLLLRQLQQQQQPLGSCGAAAGVAASAAPVGMECVPDLNALLRLVTSTGAPLYQMAAQVGVVERGGGSGSSMPAQAVSSCNGELSYSRHSLWYRYCADLLLAP
jgi:hypothetical protein